MKQKTNPRISNLRDRITTMRRSQIMLNMTTNVDLFFGLWIIGSYESPSIAVFHSGLWNWVTWNDYLHSSLSFTGSGFGTTSK